MQPYSGFRPTPFDSHISTDSQEDWLVAPVTQNRDSGCLERSNFTVVSKEIGKLDPGEQDHQIHRFGHWGPGWFEIILVRPDSPAAGLAEEWERALDNYPVASDEHWSELESNEAYEYWHGMSLKQRLDILERCDAKVSMFAIRRDEIPQDDRLEEYLRRDC